MSHESDPRSSSPQTAGNSASPSTSISTGASLLRVMVAVDVCTSLTVMSAFGDVACAAAKRVSSNASEVWEGSSMELSMSTLIVSL